MFAISEMCELLFPPEHELMRCSGQCFFWIFFIFLIFLKETGDEGSLEMLSFEMHHKEPQLFILVDKKYTVYLRICGISRWLPLANEKASKKKKKKTWKKTPTKQATKQRQYNRYKLNSGLYWHSQYGNQKLIQNARGYILCNVLFCGPHIT